MSLRFPLSENTAALSAPNLAERPPLAQLHPLAEIMRLAAKGAGTMVAWQAAGIVLNLAGAVILSRVLGPGLWGVFAIAQVVYMGSREILGRGITPYLIKQAAAPSAKDIRSAFALQHLAALAFWLATLIAARPAATWYRHAELTPLLLASGFASYSFALRAVPVALLERAFRYAEVGAIELTEAATFNGLAIAFACFGHAIAGLAIATMARGALPTALAFFWKPVRPALYFCWRNSVAIAGFGFFMGASSLVNVALLLVPALFVGKQAGTYALGLAQMAFALYGNFLFATASVLRLGFSTYSRLAEFSGELERNVNRHLQMLSVLMVPAIALFAGFSPYWVPAVFGTKWRNLPPLLVALAPGYLLASVFWGVLNPALLAVGRHRSLFLWLACITSTYAGLTWWLTPHLAAMGVAVAFSLSQLLLLPALLWIFSRTGSRLHPGKTFRELILGSAFLYPLWILVQRSVSTAMVLTAGFLGWWLVRNRECLRGMQATLRDL